MKFAANILVSALVSAATLYGLYNYAPLSLVEREPEPLFGTTITTINGSDTISGSRTTINNNFSALNAGKIENSTTSLPLLTTLANLATVGTITSGTWNASVIGVAYGGTASTSIASNQVILGNGSSGFKTVDGFGTAGQFLTSNGAATAPSWSSGAIDTTQNYNWTGINRFSTLHSSSTITFATGATSKAWSFPLVDAASSSVLSSNGSGGLSFETLAQIGAGGSFIASTTDTNVNDTASDTNYGAGTILTIPAGQLGSTGTFYARAYITNYTISAGGEAVTVKLKLGGTTVCNVDLPAPTSATGQSLISFTLISTSTTAQVCQSLAQVGLSATTIATRYSETFSAVNTASAQAVTMTAAWSANTGATESFTFGGVTVGYLGR